MNVLPSFLHNQTKCQYFVSHNNLYMWYRKNCFSMLVKSKHGQSQSFIYYFPISCKTYLRHLLRYIQNQHQTSWILLSGLVSDLLELFCNKWKLLPVPEPALTALIQRFLLVLPGNSKYKYSQNMI